MHTICIHANDASKIRGSAHRLPSTEIILGPPGPSVDSACGLLVTKAAAKPRLVAGVHGGVDDFIKKRNEYDISWWLLDLLLKV